MDFDYIVRTLVDFGYKRQDQVLEEGDFSRRGEIIDVYPVTFECPIRISHEFDKVESIVSIDIQASRVIWKHQVVIILPKAKDYRRQLSAFTEERPLNLFVELKRGDYVVHIQHGVGRYLGMEKGPGPQGARDCFVIEYANREKLFVPAQDAHLIQKYVGLKGRAPKINRLGTKEWEAVKNKVKKNLKTIAIGLLRTQAERSLAKGFAFSKDTEWQTQFEKTFPYEETPDQVKAMKDVKLDMESAHPMDRLLCGDVGYGKTEVAMRAAIKAVLDNKQVAFLVPTTILAEQHYHNFVSRLTDFPINVQMLSRFKTEGEQKTILEGVKNGFVDIVIGTHRLLSDDIMFKDLGLLIIDEEQRFGVKAKEKLKSLRLSVDILTLTATPIPRTLYMSLMGAKDISVINTPPQNRIPVSTYVIEYDDGLIKQAITKEFNRHGQVFFVHNQVENIAEVVLKIKNLMGDSGKIAFAHGQMPEKQLEDIMGAFLEGKIDCLVCTTIIQSGIDIPSANTLLVNNAHRFGLADLHQLRGRVGRFNRKAYAFFLIPRVEMLTEEARRRLEAIRAYSELGAGFKIAMEDMELRGAGNLLGYQQHGFIQAVGFDLYCRLIRETINNLKEGKE